jgi:hypothetical protein
VRDQFEPTHVVPDGGLPTYQAADVDRPSASLDAGLDVRVAQRLGDWAQVVCSNGWSAWVDGRRLEPLGADEQTDPAPLIDGELASLLDAALAQYALLVDDLKAGRLDETGFRRKAFQAGLVVRDAEAWILDLSSQRWWRYDGVDLTTVAVEPPTPTGA